MEGVLNSLTFFFFNDVSARESVLKRISGMFRRRIVVLRDGLRLHEIKFCKASESGQNAGGQMLGSQLLFRAQRCVADTRIAPRTSHRVLFCLTKVDGFPINNNHFQSRTQNGHPYPARHRAALQPMQSGGRGES